MSFRAQSEQALSLVRGYKDSGLDLDIQAFLIDCQVRNLSPNTLRIYRTQLGAFQAWFSNKSAERATSQDMRSYFLCVRQHHNSGGQHQAYRVLKTFFRWLVAEDELEDSPMRRVRAPRMTVEPLDPILLETVKAMLATCKGKGILDRRDTALLLFLVDTGVRASEALAVDWADVDLRGGAVMLRETKNHSPRVAYLGGRTRKAPI